MKKPHIDNYLESHNNKFMYLSLSMLEAKRLDELPDYIKKKFTKKTTELAFEHVSKNEVPDYIAEQLENAEEEE